MSIIGIDFGSQNCVIACARRGGVDTLLNEGSNRQTASAVSFSGKERLLGDNAKLQATTNSKNTILELKDLIGRTPAEAEETLKHVRYGHHVSEDGQLLLDVMYDEEMRSFTATQLTAMLLTKLRDVAVTGNDNVPFADCVISVPFWWTDAHRRALLDACRIAGVKCLRLMHDSTATALAYGIFKTDLPDGEDKPPAHVLFVDVGHRDTTASVVAFKKAKLSVVSTAYDHELGGLAFDRLLLDHFTAEFKEKYKIDVSTNPKAQVRLLAACEKLKKVLSGNREAPINLEVLMDDKDVKGFMKREDFEKMAAPLRQRVHAVVAKALAAAELTPDQLLDVEIVGQAVRIPMVQDAIREAVGGRSLSRTLDQAECVARGCALQCAILSPLFRVREFAIQDKSPYGIKLCWSQRPDLAEAGEDDSTEIFPAGNVIPSTKVLTFYRKEPFDMTATYSDASALPRHAPEHVGTFKVKDIKAKDDGEAPKVKVRVRLDLHGTCQLEKAEMVESIEVMVPATPAPAPAADAAAAAPAAAAAGDTPMPDASPAAADAPVPGAATPDDAAAAAGDAAAAPTPTADAAPAAAAADGAAAEPAAQPEMVAKKKLVRTTLPVDSETRSLTQKQVDLYVEQEAQMALQDRIIIETANARNDLESYVYDTRGRVNGGAWEPYTDPGVKESFVSQLNDMENWLYEDGEDETKKVYLAKHAELKAVGDKIEHRVNEANNRSAAVDNLRAVIKSWHSAATGKEAKYDHISEEDKMKVVAEVSAAEGWIATQLATIDAAPKHVDPAVTVAQITAKADELTRFCAPIMNKPKPAPPKKDDATAKKDDAAAKTDDAAANKDNSAKPAEANGDAAAAATAEANGKAETNGTAEPMDTTPTDLD